MDEPMQWRDIQIAIRALLGDPFAEHKLRQGVKRLNNPDCVDILLDWFARAAADREGDARAQARPASTMLAPLQGVSFGAVVTGGVLLAGTTIAPVVAAGMFVGGLVSAGASTFAPSDV